MKLRTLPVFAVAACCALLFAQGPRPPAPRTKKLILAWADIRNGVQHESVSHALATIERLGYESGLYDTVIRTDSQLITKHKVTGSDGQDVRAKNLNDFDAIFFYGLREIDLTALQRADLLAFVKDDGKGFVAAHTADTAFLSWPEFGEMLGGRYDDHPWNVTDAPVINEDPEFPATKHLPAVVTLRDEMYQTKDFSRDKIRVLLRLDVSHLDMTRRDVHRTDGDFPLAWAKAYGKGRVFYSSLGHDITAWDNPQLQKMWFEAIRWSLGLTSADITPRPRPAR
jgi:type 1 glutamine amidotransferase